MATLQPKVRATHQNYTIIQFTLQNVRLDSNVNLVKVEAEGTAIPDRNRDTYGEYF